MSKTAAIILSSPRKGSNSGALGRAIAEGFVQAGGQADIIDLSGLDIKPCLGCAHCQRNGGKCSQIDGMHTVYPKIIAASVLVLATPVYWFTMCGQMKVFLDRCFAVAVGEKVAFADKTIAAAFSFGALDLDSSGARNAIKIFQDICRHTRATWGGFVSASGPDRDAFVKNEAILRPARELGQTLMG